MVNGTRWFFVNFSMACIDAAIADHLILLFWDVADDTLNGEIQRIDVV